MIERIKEDKLFYGVLAGLAVVLGAWYFMMRAPIVQRIGSYTNRHAIVKKQLDELSQKGTVSREQLDPAQDAIKELTSRLTALSDRLRFVPDPKFKAPSGQGAMLHFQNMRLNSKEVADMARKRNIGWSDKIQHLNFATLPNNDADAEELLVRLDLMYRVLETIFGLNGEAGVVVNRIEDVLPMFGSQGGAQSAPAVNPNIFLNKVKVAVRIRCNGLAAFRAVHALGVPDKKGRGTLNVEEYVISRDDPTVDLVDVTIVVSALMVDPSKPLVEGETP
jgi:hypothetical protein